MEISKSEYLPYSHYQQIYMILEHVLLEVVQQNKVGKIGHWMVYDTLDKHLFGAELHNQDKKFVFELFIQILYYSNVSKMQRNRIKWKQDQFTNLTWSTYHMSSRTSKYGRFSWHNKTYWTFKVFTQIFSGDNIILNE